MYEPLLLDRYAGPDQMTLWEEDEHPREPSGTSKGGQFAPKRGPKGGEKINRNTIWGKLRLKGTSEDHTECENCGRKDLKKTVVYEQVDDDGNGTGQYCYFGTECASKVTGTSGGGKKIKRDAIEADYREKMEKKRDDDRMLRVKDSKHEALKVAGGTNRFSGDRFGNGIWMTDGKQWVRADKADPKDIPFFEAQGFATKSFEELTKERKGSKSKDSNKVPMRQAKAGGEYSDVTGKWYKGGHWMPVHGAHSGQEKKPKADSDAGAGSPEADQNEPKRKPEARKKDSYQAEEDRERQARRRNWDEILAGPIGKSLHLGDRPHAIRRLSVSGRLNTWHEQAESVGDAWMKAAADKAREIALRDAGSPDDKEWLTDDVENHQVPDAYNYYANAKQKKLAKQFPNVERIRNWLQYIDSDLEDALLEITRSANETSKTAKYATIAYAVHRYVSKAQADAGNYKMRHERLHGLAISVETPKGKHRRPEWPPMPCDYGYIKRTKGRDGDHVDVFIGPNKQSELVVVVDQVDQSGKFDEHKCLLGFDTTQKAIDCYLSAYTKGWNLGPVTTMTIGQFKNWLSKGSQRSQLSQQVSRYAQEYAARYAARNDSDDLWFADSSQIDRYDWQNQPRAPKGVANGGQWIGADGSATANPSSVAGLRSAFNQMQGRSGNKSLGAPKPKQPRKSGLPELPGSTPGAGVKRELAERPRIGPEHELHYSNLPQEWKDKVLKWHWDMHEIAWPMQKIDQSLTEEQNAARGWPMVDKDKLRGKLDEMNAMNREAEAQGIKLHEYVNASGLINRHIAARLDGGSRFFDPEKLGTRILKPVSQPLSPEHAEQAYNPQPDQGKPDLKNAVVDAFRKADAATRREMKRDPEQLKAIEEGMGIGRKAPTHTPTPEASAEPDTPAWHPQSAADMSKRASGSLDRAVKDAVGSDPGKVEYFKDLAKQAWQQQTNEAQEHNEMIRTIAGFFNKSQGNRVIAGKDGAKGRKIAVKDPGVGGLVNWARAGRGDVDKNRFDELTEFATRTYPQIQNEDDLRATLAEGIKTLPRPHDDAVIEQAMGMVGPGFFDEEPAATEEANEDAWETIPFSVRSELLHAISRYWFEKKPERYQFCA